jgi:hypothetical protein
MKNILVLLLVANSYALVGQQPHLNSMVSVTGEALVRVKPDQVVIKVRVENEGDNAIDVKKANDVAIDAILKFCRQQKIAAKDVQTEYLNLNKNYDYNTKEYNYKANQTLSIMLRHLDKYEQLISGLLEAGVNRIDGVQFKSSTLEMHLSDARKKAVANAKQKAVEYAAVLGQTVGKAIQISEMDMMQGPNPVFRTDMKMSASFSAESSETIAAGELLVSAKVNISFQLN